MKIPQFNSAITNKSDIGHAHTILVKSPDIPSNANLNDYKSVGFHTCGQSNSLTLLNKPSNFTNGGCRLEVLSSGNGVTQVLRTYGSNDSLIKLYFRHYYGSSNVWTSWQQVNTTIID